MSHFKINRQDIYFILKEQLNYGSLSDLNRYRDLNENAFDMLINEALNFARGVVGPLQDVGERFGVRFADGQVTNPAEFKRAFRQYGQDGWIAAARDPEFGGQGFPHMMRIVINDFMYGACQAFNMAPSLTHGAAHLIESFGNRTIKELFVPRMFDGTWSGTMCLTEADAGSNLAAIQTRAYPAGDHYHIRGSKIFISWGDHNLTENIIHLVLARIDGAPAGVHGISLFVVPKMRVRPDGSIAESNNVSCSRVEEKLGLHASPTCVLDFGRNGNCVGYLCGQANQGLSHMFQMMNSARINTGVSGMALAGCAYRNALEYAKGRLQGRDLAGRQTGQVPIIDHPDVRRMLLWMKAAVDGMRSMIYRTAYWQDLALELPEGENQRHYARLLDFMTPIIKAYCSDMGFRVCETAIQCLGGYGYCKGFPLEQYLRDAKIMSLYEGTNGIQSMDLMGRKMCIDDGAPFNAYALEIESFCRQNRDDSELGKRVGELSEVFGKLVELAKKMTDQMQTDPIQWASQTYPVLMAFGELSVTWHLLDMAIVARRGLDRSNHKSANFYTGKVLQATAFADSVLAHTIATIAATSKWGREAVDMPAEAF